ncbi:hypothetical protein C8R43DRAFT_1132858 [Mycena crocata]|nr:hypothetical protein C8R43DRAFT_1132858 [Mycena crocata]
MKGLSEDLKIWAAERHQRAAELAEKHGIKVKEVLRRMINSSTFKARCAPSLYNTKISRIMGDLNEGLDLGERYKMTQVKAMVKSDPTLLTKFSKEEEEEMMEEAHERVQTKYRGTRANNKAAQADARKTLERLAWEITALTERSGMIGFAMFTRGHLHNTTFPMSIQSWGALEFFREILKKDPADVATWFELWAVSRERASGNTDGLLATQKECTRIIKDGLMRELNVTKIAMNFENYINTLVLGKNIGLVNWRHGVEFKHMSLQSSIGPLRTLRDALKNGTCHWMTLQDGERKQLLDQWKDMLVNGEAKEPVKKSALEKAEAKALKKGTERAAKKSAAKASKDKSSSKKKKAAGGSKGKEGVKLRKSRKRTRVEDSEEEEEGWVDVWDDPNIRKKPLGYIVLSSPCNLHCLIGKSPLCSTW